jgi:shikimate kinase
MANIVLSTGGGAVLRPGNRERLKDNGTVVYLHAEPSTLYGRIRHNRNRPLLRTADQLARLAELYAAPRCALPRDGGIRGRVGARRGDAPRALV